ncbi:MAG TPA: AraC family transcriptional regulator, partial [Candidatus Eisenbergiella intestinipullorum]|nr:AraC family transcriptional regulator [Candidatus Eisenbergiella intestinipullorum]
IAARKSLPYQPGSHTVIRKHRTDQAETVTPSEAKSSHRSAEYCSMAAMDIDSAEVFDENLAYYDFMYCWKQVDEMKEAIVYVVDRLYELSDQKSGRDVVQSTIHYIRQNIDSDILVSELAERVGMNPEYLTRIFKKTTGYSLKKFIDNEKMEAAKMLLTTTNLPVTIVSERVGYANYSNFTRSFKQIVGYTPTEFRGAAKIPGKKDQKSSYDR